jgi:hypothetical protein
MPEDTTDETDEIEQRLETEVEERIPGIDSNDYTIDISDDSASVSFSEEFKSRSETGGDDA